MRNERGIALLIVLLVTALLIALIFEFAYATRVSLRAAVNFRDSQRAELLARSGVNAFIKYPQLRDNTKQGDWNIVPIVSAGDTELRIRWTDERGKIPVGGSSLGDKDVSKWLNTLFENQGINTTILDAINEEYKTKNFRLQFLGELHRFMSDEDYTKVSGFLTALSDQKAINVNTAPEAVLKSLGIEPTIILANRPYTSTGDITSVDTYTKSFIVLDSKKYTVESFATVGDYTKQVTAIVDLSAGTFLYWRNM